MNLKDIRREEYKRAVEWGFKPKHKVQHSISKKHYFLSDPDYAKFKKIVDSKITESFKTN